MSIKHLLEKFPKVRPCLDESLRIIHRHHYHINRNGRTPVTSITKKLEKWLHKCVASDVYGVSSFKPDTLEIGAGTLNHLEYERNKNLTYDIVEPFVDLYKNSEELKLVRNAYSDIQDIKQFRYDRIISIAVLEHILNLPAVVARSALLLKPGGSFRAAIPNEGSLFWYLGWRLTTGIEFKLKYGVDYSLIMNYEHVNTAHEVEQIINIFFKKNKKKYFGFGKYLSFYAFYEAQDPNFSACNAYINGEPVNEA